MRKEIEKVWQEFWKDIVCDENGSINLEQLKKELHDFYTIMQEVPKVYSEITGGMLSYITYPAETVLGVYYDRFGNKIWSLECLPDDWDDITADCETNEDYKKVLFKYLEIEEDEGYIN